MADKLLQIPVNHYAATMQPFVPYIIITKLLSLKIYINLWKLI